jgi:hypothetical protein
MSITSIFTVIRKPFNIRAMLCLHFLFYLYAVFFLQNWLISTLCDFHHLFVALFAISIVIFQNSLLITLLWCLILGICFVIGIGFCFIRYGGTYLDSDIIVLKPISFLNNSVGMEDHAAGSSLNGAVMAFGRRRYC